MDTVLKNNTPFSEKFDDIYFNQDHGIDESAYVFLEQSGFLDKLENNENLTICELGFGTGLNFLSTWKAWKNKGQNQ